MTITEELMAANPAFNRLEQDARSGYAAFRDGTTPAAPPGPPAHPQQAYPQQAYGQPGAPVGQDHLEHMYNAPSATPVQAGRVTMDDVIMKTLGLFAIVLAFGAAGWFAAATNLSLADLGATLGLSVAAGAGLSLLGVVYPAAVAARMRPVEAMRAQE